MAPLPPPCSGEPRGLLYDPRTREHWVFTDRFLFQLVIVAEDRNMWELHLAKGQYEDALVHCKNNEQKDGEKGAHERTVTLG